MSFSVTILGSGAAIPTSQRNPTAQYVQCSERHILIDCGEGTQIQIRKLGIKFQRINYILISHLHGDHYFGLVGLLSTMHLLGREKPIQIYGPPGLKELIMNQIHAGGGGLAFEISFVELEKDSSGVLFEDAKIKINYFPLSHRVPTSGFVITQKVKERRLRADKAKRDGVKIEHYHRLKAGEDIEFEGKSFLSEDYTESNGPELKYAFCSDTEYMPNVVESVKGVDLLYHEATFLENLRDRAEATKHSTAGDAAKVAKEASVGKLLMGHLSARYENGELHLEEARPIFENCAVPEDGDVFVVGIFKK